MTIYINCRACSAEGDLGIEIEKGLLDDRDIVYCNNCSQLYEAMLSLRHLQFKESDSRPKPIRELDIGPIVVNDKNYVLIALEDEEGFGE